MTTYFPAKKGAEFITYIGLPSVASTNIFQANPTIAAGDFKVSIDGGALANLTTLPAVTPASSKMVKITLSASETNGDNITVICSDAAGGEWKDVLFNVQTSARQIDDLCYPTTSGRSLDVTATGAAGIDWGNVENLTTSNALTGTTIATTQKVDVETIKTNPVVNAGTVTFPTTATLASTTNITAGTMTTTTNLTNLPTIPADWLTAAGTAADFGTEIGTAVWAAATRVLTANTNLNDPSAATVAAAVWDLDATAHQTQGTFGQAIGDPAADTNTIYKAVVTDAAGTNIAADIVAVKADTAEIGAAGAGLTNINLPNQTMDIVGNITGNLSGSVGSVTGAVGSVTGSVGSVTAGVTLAASAVQAIWDALTSALTTVGSIGKLLVDNVNATISSRASQTSLDTVDDFLDTEIAAILSDTNAILVDTAEIGVAGAGLTNINLPNQTMDIVGNITGNLSGSVGSVTGAVGSVTGAVGSVTGLTAADVAAIKAKTDSLTFTVAGKVDSNVKYVADTQIDGVGSEADPWGPV